MRMVAQMGVNVTISEEIYGHYNVGKKTYSSGTNRFVWEQTIVREKAGLRISLGEKMQGTINIRGITIMPLF